MEAPPFMFWCPRGFEPACQGELAEACGVPAVALPGWGILLASPHDGMSTEEMIHKCASLLSVEYACAYLGRIALPRAQLEDAGTSAQDKVDLVKAAVAAAEGQLQWQRALRAWHYCRPDLTCSYAPTYAVEPGQMWPIGGLHTAQKHKEGGAAGQPAKQQPGGAPAADREQPGQGEQEQGEGQEQQGQGEEQQQQGPQVRFRVTLERLDYKHKSLRREDFAGGPAVAARCRLAGWAARAWQAVAAGRPAPLLEPRCRCAARAQAAWATHAGTRWSSTCAWWSA
jgi:hypothetical protein